MTRDNEKRMGASVELPPSALAPPAIGTQVLSFAAPTEIVELPSQGKFYPEGHILRGVSEVEIRHMTAKEEDILTNVTLIKKGLAVDRMLDSVITTPGVKVNNMLVGDKNALTVAARITGFGPEYSTKVRCLACSETTTHEFDLNQPKVKEVSEFPANVELTPTNTFLITGLPKCEHVVEVRLMTGKDEQALSKSSEKKKKKDLPQTLITDQLKMVIVSVGGSTHAMDIGAFVNTMPLLTTKALQKLYRELTPNIDLTQEFVCTKCGNEEEMEVPFSTEFFWPKQ